MGDKNFVLNVGNYDSQIRASFEKLRKERIVQRIWAHDYTVWKPEATEVTNRLGWLHSPVEMGNHIQEIQDFVDEVRSEGFTHALLLGIGGSSLAPGVFRRIFGVKAAYLDMAILDSTTPGTVLSFARKLNPETTLYIASTKSGETVETLSFTKYFYNYVLQKVNADQVGRHFITITDPDSGLESLAKDLKFRKIFLNDPDIGGRFSALSFFGLIPAGLIGLNLTILLNRAATMVRGSKNGDPSGNLLGTIMGELVQQDRDKLTFIMSPTIVPFGDWVEQLIAESTGKEGVGILPVVGEALLSPDDYANDRLFIYIKMNGDSTFDRQVNELINGGVPVVQIHLQDNYDLGGEFFRWEMATAIAGYFLKINPFDQPNVEAAKALTRKMMAAYYETGKLPEFKPSLTIDGLAVFTDDNVNSLEQALEQFLNKADPGKNGRTRSYIAIQAFIEPTNATNAALQVFRTRLQHKYRMATTVGYGPRFLHSTGQLHKGDSGNGLFIQVTSDFSEDVPIPDRAGEESSSITFGVLALAQALGDRQVLVDTNRKVIRFHLNEDTVSGIKKLTAAI